ncbi:MAG: hypothetical protein R2795_12835 [Saprospiraceae bacterium]
MRTPFITTFLLLLLGAGLFTGCDAAKSYKLAQDAFSNGATKETLDRMQAAAKPLPSNFANLKDMYHTSGSPLDTARSATSYYQEALGGIQKALKGGPQLEKLAALDNAKALEALIYWRLDNAPTAKEKAIAALPDLEANTGEENDIRDRAMMLALPGLINMDKAYQALKVCQATARTLSATMSQEEKNAVFQQVKGIYTKSITDTADGAPSVARGMTLITDALASTEDKGAVTVYLHCARLAGLDTWGDMLQEVFTVSRRAEIAAEEANWVNAERNTFEAKRIDYLSQLEALLGSKNDKLYQYWKELL